MASYIQPNDYQIYQTAPFLPDKESIGRALMYRQSQYDAGVARIAGIQNNMLNLDVTNLENKARLSEYNTKAKEQLNRMGKADFSQQDNVVAAERVFDPITEDKYILNDIATTTHFRKQFKLADDLKTKDKGAAYNEDNLRYVQNSFEKFVTAKGNEQFNVEKREYSPYVDVIANMNKIAKDMGVTVEKDLSAPNGYIIKQKNGAIAYGPLRDMFMSNLSGADRNQLRIEATVGYENAVKLMGEPQAAGEMASRYLDSLSRQKSINEGLLSDIDRGIKEVEALGSKATAEQLQYLTQWREQRGILDSNIKGSAKAITKVGEWSAEDMIKFAPGLANEMYADTRANNWAKGYADVTAVTKIDKDDAYWKNLEYNRHNYESDREYQLAVDRLRLDASKESSKDGNDKETAAERKAREAAAAADPTNPANWRSLGPNNLPEERLSDYNSVVSSVVAAKDGLLQYKQAAMDEYWDKKSDGGFKTYSAISKAIQAKNGNATLASLVTAYNSDADLTNNIDLNKYAAALGITPEQVGNLSIKDVFDKMNNGFDSYIKNAQSVPSGDLNPYLYSTELQNKQELANYYSDIYKKVNKQAFSNYQFKPVTAPPGITITESIFVNSDGSVKPLSKVKEDYAAATGTSVSGTIGSTYDPISGTIKKPDSASMDGVATLYNSFVKEYNKLRDTSAKTLSKNTEYTSYATDNDDKVKDLADVVSRKLVHNFDGVNTALFAGQFTEDELKLLKNFNTNTSDLVASVEMTPFPESGTEYVVKFSPDKLINGKYIDPKGKIGEGLLNKLTSGVVFKGVKNLPELEIAPDTAKFLIDNGRKIERNFGDNYNFKITRINSPQGARYLVQGTKAVPDYNQDGTLNRGEDGRILFKKESIEIPVNPGNMSLDAQLATLSKAFYNMNAIYVYSRRQDVNDRKLTDPAYIKSYEQLKSAAIKEYKLNVD